VAGIYLDLNQPSDGKGLDWLLQRDIVIREGRLQWTDRQRAAPPLALDNVAVVLRNQWLHHQLAARHAAGRAGRAARCARRLHPPGLWRAHFQRLDVEGRALCRYPQHRPAGVESLARLSV
jgi:hypothetical protein